jgi:hypothetical protein
MQDKTSDDKNKVLDSEVFDFSALPNREKERLIPPLGYTIPVLFNVDIPGQEGQRMALFRVTARNPGKLRFSAELYGFAPKPRPAAPPPGAGESIDLEVQSGVMGGGSTFKHKKD